MPRSYATSHTSGGGGSPGGNNTDVQFNSSGTFGGDDNLTWNNTDKILTVPTIHNPSASPLIIATTDNSPVQILSGPGPSATPGGEIDITAGNGGDTSSTGGSFSITSGNGGTPDGNGGDINITGGTPSGAGTAGNLVINARNISMDTTNMSLPLGGLFTNTIFDQVNTSILIDMTTQDMKTAGGLPTLNWTSGILTSPSTSNTSLDWSGRQLIASDGTTVVLDWNSTTPVFHGQFADNETPSGSIDGSNVTFTLANSPSPDVSLQLIYQGQFQLFGTDYTLSGNTITFTVAPAAGTWIRAYYRF